MSKQQILIHIGYHKTGTTWLQKVLFQPNYGYVSLMSHEEVFEHIVRPHGLVFHPKNAQNLISNRLNKLEQETTGVISSEILCGHPFYGGRESEQFARHLYNINPQAHILITIRSQIPMIVSVYMQYISRGGTLSPEVFFADNPVMGYRRFAPEHFEYHRLIAYYHKLFGRDNVLVVTQESLTKNALAFAQKLSVFSGSTPINQLKTENKVAISNPEYTACLLRRINHFQSGPASDEPIIDLGDFAHILYRAVGALGRKNAIRKLLKNIHPVKDYVKFRFEGRFKESNRQLKKMLADDIDLELYEL